MYRATQSFPADERFGLTSQLRRSAASVGANLAEGCGRRSDGEMSRYVQIAMGSPAELSYHLLLSRDLKFLGGSQFETLNASTQEVLKMLSSLSARLKDNANDGKLSAKAASASAGS
ncbi:MAG: four helix bundle protein [Terriglobales bacterium]